MLEGALFQSNIGPAEAGGAWLSENDGVSVEGNEVVDNWTFGTGGGLFVHARSVSGLSASARPTGS